MGDNNYNIFAVHWLAGRFVRSDDRCEDSVERPSSFSKPQLNIALSVLTTNVLLCSAYLHKYSFAR